MSATKVGAVIVGVGAIAGGVVAWVQWDLPLDARWAITLIVTLGILIGVGLIVGQLTESRGRFTRFLAAAVLALAIGGLAFLLLQISTLYHSVRIVHESCGADRPGWRCIEYWPPRRPVNFNVVLSTREGGGIAEWSPGLRGASIGTEWSMQEDEYSLTVRLTAFRTPDRFGVEYRRPESSALVTDEIQGLDPPATPVLREAEVARLDSWAFVWGGAICVVGFILLYSSRHWVLWFNPKSQSNSHTAG